MLPKKSPSDQTIRKIREDIQRRGVILATNNAGKANEFRAAFDRLGIVLTLPHELGLTFDVEETGSTFHENAALKAAALNRLAGRPSVADDSGLVVDALGGSPGVFSARYGGSALDDGGRRLLLLRELAGVLPEKRTARFVCVLALNYDGVEENSLFCEGRAEGTIATLERGANGFGYDPVFLDSSGRTFAELLPKEKEERSHRGRAIRELVRLLEGKNLPQGD